MSTWDAIDEEVSLARRTAAWLFRNGFPVDWTTDTPPPGATKRWLIDLWMADAHEHGDGISREEVKAWLLEEAGWEKW